MTSPQSLNGAKSVKKNPPNWAGFLCRLRSLQTAVDNSEIPLHPHWPVRLQRQDGVDQVADGPNPIRDAKGAPGVVRSASWTRQRL